MKSLNYIFLRYFHPVFKIANNNWQFGESIITYVHFLWQFIKTCLCFMVIGRHMGQFVRFKIFTKLLAVCHVFSVSRLVYMTTSYILTNVGTYVTSLELSWVNIYKDSADNIMGLCTSISYCPILFLFKRSFPCFFWGHFIYICFHIDQWIFFK